MTFNNDRHILHNQKPLTTDQILQTAPSALALAPADDRSTRYTYIPTIDVIKGMENAGFLPFSAVQSRCRVENHKMFTKHMIRFRHASHLEGLTAIVGNSVPEVVLINSHDGSSAYKLMLGIFRFVCANGMVVSDSMQGSISVRHQGNIIDRVVEASASIVERAPKVLDAVQTWSNLLLSDGEQTAFATAAHNLRFEDNDVSKSPIQPEQLLKPRRPEDNGNDLWATFNRIQEHVIKGGDKGYKVEDTTKVRRVTSRAVKGIDQDVRLNRSLWILAEKMAELKGISVAA